MKNSDFPSQMKRDLKNEKCSDGIQLSAKNVTLLKDTPFSEKKMKVQISCEQKTAQIDI